MYSYRPSRNKIFLLSLILIQLCLIASYFIFYKAESKQKLNKILFLPKVHIPDKPDRRTYYTLNDTINLKRITTRGFFLDFNSSMCFTEGTDIKTMIVVKGINWKCNCLSGWHGPDCGYPEVFFRALLAKKQTLKLKGPGAFQRRLIYMFKYDRCSANLADMRISALGDIVDLFILYESENYFERQLKSKMFKQWQHKILYIPNNREMNVWEIAESQIRNLRRDDYIISSSSNEIPDRASLIFLKFYENVPEPIYFRLKWSVFGFFWIHPKKTLISGGACTVAYLKNILNNNIDALTNNKTLANLSHKGITLGDLNHTGGWFCEYCAAPDDIIEYLTSNSSKHLVNWDRIGTTKITHKFIENLIELGVYIDGKTELERGHRYSDVDFAPPYVLDNDFKFDFLLKSRLKKKLKAFLSLKFDLDCDPTFCKKINNMKPKNPMERLRYPASVFVGDTFCYFSGMTFAVVGILGHFSKTTLLFFIPQVFNFIYSFPQLLKFIPCPRHRLPKFNSRTDRMECSTTVFKYSSLSILGKIIINVFRLFRLINWEEKGGVVVTNNFTLINLVLLYLGPMHEAKLTTVLLVIQIMCTILAFVIRYPFASVFYDVPFN